MRCYIKTQVAHTSKSEVNDTKHKEKASTNFAHV